MLWCILLLSQNAHAKSLPAIKPLKVKSIQTLVAPKDAGSELLAACADLQSVFKDQTGQALELQLEASSSLKQAILLQIRASGPREGAFYIERQSEQINICSANQTGLVHAIYTYAGTSSMPAGTGREIKDWNTSHRQ